MELFGKACVDDALWQLRAWIGPATELQIADCYGYQMSWAQEGILAANTIVSSLHQTNENNYSAVVTVYEHHPNVLSHICVVACQHLTVLRHATGMANNYVAYPKCI